MIIIKAIIYYVIWWLQNMNHITITARCLLLGNWSPQKLLSLADHSLFNGFAKSCRSIQLYTANSFMDWIVEIFTNNGGGGRWKESGRLPFKIAQTLSHRRRRWLAPVMSWNSEFKSSWRWTAEASEMWYLSLNVARLECRWKQSFWVNSNYI